ncbi:MAG: iron hydrogenase [Patescibacteria group bacterium]|nr:iron hydrogenase [Patescibacteria group bacterium]
MNMTEQVGAIAKEKSFTVVGTFLLLFGGVMLAPLFPNQFIAGPIVNALLFIVTVMLGLRAGVLMCFIPSLMALLGGLLPAVLAPFVPFIMFGNIVMVALFHWLRGRNFWLASGAGGVAKFIFLFITSQLFFKWFLSGSLAQGLALMLSWNQLYSALMGAIIAYVFLKTIKRI